MQLYLWIELKIKKVRRVLEIDQVKLLKPYTENNSQKTIEAEKNDNKDGKALRN